MLMSRQLFPVVLCAAVAVTACGGNKSQGAPGGAGGRGGAFPAMPVQTIKVEPKPIPQTSEYVATVRSLRSSVVQPQVEGYIRQIMVKAGDHVRAGQPMMQIDPERQQATVATTQSQRASAEASLEYAKQQLARNQKLLDAGAISQSELEQAQTSVKTAQAQVDALNSQIKENQVQLAYYRVTAPSDGVIGDISVREGDRVTPMTEITTIDSEQGLEAYINVPIER